MRGDDTAQSGGGSPVHMDIFWDYKEEEYTE